MIGSKQIKIKKSIYDDLSKIKGSSASEKLAELLRGYSKCVPKEEIVTKLLNAHMNDVKLILERQDNIIDSQAKDIQNFISKVTPLMKHIERSTGGY